MAWVESEPGIERSSLVIRPIVLASITIATAATAQIASTSLAWRTVHCENR